MNAWHYGYVHLCSANQLTTEWWYNPFNFRSIWDDANDQNGIVSKQIVVLTAIAGSSYMFSAL